MSFTRYGTRLEATIAEVKSMAPAGFALTAIDGDGERHVVITPKQFGLGETVTIVLEPGRWLPDGVWQIATD